MLLPVEVAGAPSFLEIRNGYFWDRGAGTYFIPRGFGYQTFNPPVGAEQTLEQLEYDLVQFKRMYVNSLRVDLPWPQFEKQRGVYDFSGSDFLVNRAQAHGLRLFVLIGFQYAADWFPTNGYWRAINEKGDPYFIMNYEHPEVREAYSNYIYQVTSRYKDSPVIGAWILGNEYSYFDLWNSTNKLYFGYDPISQAAFRKYLKASYTNNITALNTNWGDSYTSFDEVVMPQTYPIDRKNPRYYDLTQWRKHSIGELVAIGAAAARKADPTHLLAYSMIGRIFSGDDNKYTCEDERVILEHCASVGAPLAFWSVNNYAYTAEGAEMRIADFGISKYQERVGLPVLVTETGHSSTDDLYPEERVRHAKALPTQLWEALMSGAMGVHVFTWNDRHVFGPTWFMRERGFGIVEQDRTIKDPVYWNVLEVFRRMENLNLNKLLAGSVNPPTDVQFFWSTNADMVWPRANTENAMLWGALRRVGYQPGIIDDVKFAGGSATNARALLLSRCWLMDPGHLDMIATNVIPAGVHVYANADLPGQLDRYQKPNPSWVSRMSQLFGLSVASAVPGYDQGVTNVARRGRVDFQGVTALGSLPANYVDHLGTWKVWHSIKLSSGTGTTVVTHRGNNSTQLPMPALRIKDLGTAKTAITTFALGDTDSGEPEGASNPTPPQHRWDIRYTWLRSIFRDYFNIQPAIELSGTGSGHVCPDYRVCANGSILLGFLNESTNNASVTISAPSLLSGKIVENLTSGGVLEVNSDGVVSITMSGDDYVLLYAYDAGKPSLLNPDASKIWIQTAPVAVYPNGSNWNLTVGYDLAEAGLIVGGSFERASSPAVVYAQTNFSPVSGKGLANIPLGVPDANRNDPRYVSSLDGGQYVFHVWLERNGTTFGDTYLPVRLLWGIKPLAVTGEVIPGTSVHVTIGWEELPSYLPEEGPCPLNRAELWQGYLASRQYYRVVLQLLSAGQAVATQEFLTNAGTDQHTFTVSVPSSASGPFTWNAYLQPAPGAAVDFIDSFEDRDGGNRTNGFMFAPWYSYAYPEEAGVSRWDYGVGTNASDGIKGAFLIVTNPPDPGPFSGFGMWYIYPQSFALPRDRSAWTNYSFAFDYHEAHGYSSVLELQLKDARGGQIHFTKTNSPGPDGWGTIQATLDQFEVPPWIGYFDSENVNTLVLNVQMFDRGVVYETTIDNVRFIGPKDADQWQRPFDLWSGFDDRDSGNDPNLILPWGSYAYPDGGQKWATGVGTNQGVNGGAAAFVVVTNPPNAGGLSGFGLGYNFPGPWQLPSNKAAWKEYVFSYDFRDWNNHRCTLEMQVKSGPNAWIEYTQDYVPGGWNTIRASLDQFKQPVGVATFDPNHVIGIVVNIRMLDAGALYDGKFDDIYFNAPDVLISSTAPLYGLYRSGNDEVPIIDDFFVSIKLDSSGGCILSWPAQTNRLYSVYHADGTVSDGMSFSPLSDYTNLAVTSKTTLEVKDTNALPAFRVYRVMMQKP